MSELSRLNGVIGALEKGLPTFTAFSPPEIASAIAFSTSRYDGVVFEMEHNPWDIRALRDCLQYMLNRGQIAAAGSVAPAVTPMVPKSLAALSRVTAKVAAEMVVAPVMASVPLSVIAPPAVTVKVPDTVEAPRSTSSTSVMATLAPVTSMVPKSLAA